MRLFTFKGGIHPKDGKEYSKDKAITNILPESDLLFPLSQHIGAPAKPIVQVGDLVLRGQMIAEAGGFVSAPIFSSVSGKVKAMKKHFNPTGTKVDCIVIENDGLYKETEELEKGASIDSSKLSKQEIIQKVQDSGVVGLGGAGFPTHVKFSPKEPDKIEYIIANCAECEPYITADYRRMLECPEELISGLKIALQLFDNAQGILGVEDNKKDCIKLLQELTKDEPRIKVIPLATKYPQGGERQLIYATTGRKLHSKLLPADVGCIVNNVETLIAVHHAVNHGRPLLERVVTVSGDAIENPSNFRILIGMNQNEVIQAAGGFKETPKKIISGGPMMGFAMFTTDTPITKTSSSLLCMKRDEVAERKITYCINCGRCVDVCPSGLIPSKLADCGERDLNMEFDKIHGLECIECGCCSYVCPSKRPLKQSIGSCKKVILASRRK